MSFTTKDSLSSFLPFFFTPPFTSCCSESLFVRPAAMAPCLPKGGNARIVNGSIPGLSLLYGGSAKTTVPTSTISSSSSTPTTTAPPCSSGLSRPWHIPPPPPAGAPVNRFSPFGSAPATFCAPPPRNAFPVARPVPPPAPTEPPPVRAPESRDIELTDFYDDDEHLPDAEAANLDVEQLPDAVEAANLDDEGDTTIPDSPDFFLSSPPPSTDEGFLSDAPSPVPPRQARSPRRQRLSQRRHLADIRIRQARRFQDKMSDRNQSPLSTEPTAASSEVPTGSDFDPSRPAHRGTRGGKKNRLRLEKQKVNASLAAEEAARFQKELEEKEEKEREMADLRAQVAKFEEEDRARRQEFANLESRLEEERKRAEEATRGRDEAQGKAAELTVQLQAAVDADESTKAELVRVQDELRTAQGVVKARDEQIALQQAHFDKTSRVHAHEISKRDQDNTGLSRQVDTLKGHLAETVSTLERVRDEAAGQEELVELARKNEKTAQEELADQRQVAADAQAVHESELAAQRQHAANAEATIRSDLSAQFQRDLAKQSKALKDEASKQERTTQDLEIANKTADDLKQQLDHANGELETAQRQVADLEKQLATSQAAEQTLKKKNHDLEADLDALTAQFAGLSISSNTKEATLQKKNDDLQRELDELTAQFDAFKISTVTTPPAVAPPRRNSFPSQARPVLQSSAPPAPVLPPSSSFVPKPLTSPSDGSRKHASTQTEVSTPPTTSTAVQTSPLDEDAPTSPPQASSLPRTVYTAPQLQSSTSQTAASSPPSVPVSSSSTLDPASIPLPASPTTSLADTAPPTSPASAAGPQIARRHKTISTQASGLHTTSPTAPDSQSSSSFVSPPYKVILQQPWTPPSPRRRSAAFLRTTPPSSPSYAAALPFRTAPADLPFAAAASANSSSSSSDAAALAGPSSSAAAPADSSSSSDATAPAQSSSAALPAGSPGQALLDRIEEGRITMDAAFAALDERHAALEQQLAAARPLSVGDVASNIGNYIASLPRAICSSIASFFHHYVFTIPPRRYIPAWLMMLLYFFMVMFMSITTAYEEIRWHNANDIHMGFNFFPVIASVSAFWQSLWWPYFLLLRCWSN
ncbi:hypothetical protein HDK77DRAFT_514426 [Phyllosticta capitalensis]